MRIISFTVCLCIALLAACSSCNRSSRDSKSGNAAERRYPRQRKAQIAVVSPGNNERRALGTDVILSAKARDAAEPVDSIRWFVDGKWQKTTTGEDAVWNTAGQTAGTHRIEAVACYASGQRDMVSASVVLLAGKAPAQYTYKVVHTYPHDRRAYTQGLLFDGGFLYESTGLKGESSLRKVNLQTGEPVQVTNMPADMFGEGLALVDDKLVQLTWQNQVAFIYRKNDFGAVGRIGYPMREGWGLTFDGTHLLMTDGTATLYFLDREHLTEVRRLEVCDDKAPVRDLNELEYMNGELWANVYMTDDILRIDPATGVVLGRINMAGLLNPADRNADTNVLNGIACDAKTGKIYVTGKNWPKLFEIQVMPLAR